MTRLRSTSVLLVGILALALAGCGSNSDGTADTQSSAARQARAAAKAEARAAHRRTVARRQARILARRQAHQAALRQQRAQQRQAHAEEAEVLRAEEEAAAEEETSECDANYSGACLSPTASDYDCAGGSGNGPEYTGTVTVTGEDHYGLDSDSDGVGCESE